MPDATMTPPAAAPPSSSPPAQPKANNPPINNPFADIDELFKDAPEAPPSSPPENGSPQRPTSRLRSPGESPDPEPDKKPPEKPAAKPEDKPGYSGPKELRTAYETVTKRVKELEAELEKSRNPVEDPEKKTIAERLEQVEKRRAELEDEIRYAAYERSQEYKDKYQVPLEKALKSAYDDVSQLTITDSNGNESKATEAHFNAICRMNVAQAISQAKEWFGDAATEVLAMRRNILGLRDQAQLGIEQFRKDGLERERQKSETATKQNQERQTLFKKHVEEGVSSHPELFKPADEDAKGKEILTKGMQVADTAFSGGNGLPADEVVKIHAAVRNMAGAFPYLAYRFRQGQKRIEELENKLKEYEASEPAGGGGARVPKAGQQSWEQEIEALACES